MTGTGKLIRLILRRDRVIMPLWVLLFGLLPMIYLAGFDTLFASDSERIAYAEISASSGGFVALYGPLHGTSVGELTVWRGGFVPVMIGLVALLTVIRHTRADEEAGRTELIRATVVGRRAPLAAALLATAGAGAVIALLVAGSLIGSGQPAEGSVALGAVFALSTWIFAGVGAITAQLTEGGRGARLLGVLVLGVAYVLRLGGDVSEVGDGRVGWLSWLSPIGWAHRVFPYGANDWWPAALTLIVTVVTVVVAGYLQSRRDLAAGLIASRLGPATAPARLRSPFALAWRLHRGLLLGWTGGFAALGVIFGGVGTSVTEMAEKSGSIGDMVERLGGTGDVADGYFASIAGMCGLIAACYAIQAALRLRDEEQTGHAELVLTTAVSRYAWSGGHLFFALFGPAVALFAAGVTAGLAYGDPGPVLGAMLVQLPAVWVLAGLATLTTGVLPRYAAAAWGAMAVCYLILLVGATLQWSQWVLDLSPFTHVPHLPGVAFRVVPEMVLILIAAALAGVGLMTLRRRDLPV
ncbi:ABC transporter permease [Actinoplanes sp. NPDC051851]|uniref:ABC transporter permease n=1 Tax=Actinoplanes sp. NPDC051851 TaxID=3154753 RepID=UPI00341FE1CC